VRIAAHVDQVFFDVPGGVGTYVRNLFPALAGRDPSLEIRLFHTRFEPAPEPEPWMAPFPIDELPGSIRGLYPRWNVLGRPALPAPIRSAQLVHATSASAVPPASDDQRLVVTVHDLAFERYPGMFPRTWRAVYRTGLRATVRRADAILTPSRHTAEDVLSHTKVDPAKLHVVPLAATPPAREVEVADALGRLKVRAPYVLFGHSHRSGPWARDDLSEWTTPTGTRLMNTGSWCYQPHFLSAEPNRSPYWPGTAIRVGENGPPELIRLLGDRGHDVLRPPTAVPA